MTMNSANLELPPGMDVDPQVEIKVSEMDSSRLGIWCKQKIEKGSKFGPFVGEKVLEGTDDMEPSYVWEIVDLETKDFLYYINATDPECGNWMRYINCARYYEEQNIVSQQEGTDIYYKAIKDIEPGKELLTWYEKTPFRKKKRPRKSTASTKGSRESPVLKEETPLADDAFPPEHLTNGVSTSNKSPATSVDDLDMHVSQRGRRRKVTKYWEMENLENSENSESQQDSEGENSEDDMTIASDDDWNGTSSGNSKLSEMQSLDPPPDDCPNDQYYQFEVRPYQVVKSWLGRKVFKCDICSGVYRHSFSLKRHYIRNHINHKYVSQSDLVHCNVTYKPPAENAPSTETVKSAETDKDSEEMSEIKHTAEEASVKDGDSSNQCDITCDEDKLPALPVIDTPPVDNNGNKVTREDGLDQTDAGGKTDALTKTPDPAAAECTSPSPDAQDRPSELAQVASPNPASSESILCQNTDQSPDAAKTATDVKTTIPDGSGDKCSPDETSNTLSKPDLYRCNVCEKLFDTVEELKDHLTNHPESSSKAFACDKCEMKFTHKQNLMRHQAVHTGARPYTCKFCDKKFPTITNQKRHERIHQGRRINCDHCNSTFSQTGDLKKHVRKLHPELFHECGFCAKYFASSDQLGEHLKASHNEDIESNNKEIKTRKEAFRVDLESDRAESMRLAQQRGTVVAKEKFKFACTVCKKRFVDYANMCRHRRLAHQRHMLHLGVMRKDGTELGQANSPLRALFDPDMDKNSAFYAKVAKNIADNLRYHVEGRKEELKQRDAHIKWKAARELPVVTEADNLVNYNFPSGFDIKDRTALFSSKVSLSEYVLTSGLAEKETARLVIKEPTVKNSESVCEKEPNTNQQPMNNLKNSNLHNDSKPPGAPLQSPESVSAPRKSPLALKVPDMKLCKICHTVFASNDLYREHMATKHKPKPPVLKPITAEVRMQTSDDVSALKSPPAHTHPKTESSLEPPPPVPPGVNPNHCVSLIGDHHKPPPPAHALRPMWRVERPPAPAPLNTRPKVTMCRDDKAGMPPILSEQQTSPPPLVGPMQTQAPDDKCPAEKIKLTDGAQDNKVIKTEVSEKSKSEKVVDESSAGKSQVTGDDPTLPPLKFVCLACFNEFPDEATVKAHQEDKHRAVQCKFVAVDLSFRATWFTGPNPVGALNVSSSCVPNVQTGEGQKFSCTKCKKTFASTSDLHSHILDCGDYAKNAPQLAYIWYLRGRMITPPKKKSHRHGKYRRGRSETPHKRRNMEQKFSEMPSQEATLMAQRKVLERQMSADSPDENESEFGRRRRRRVQELFYNPHNHIRRRDFAQLLGNKCMGCNEIFSAVYLLERHIVQCPEKDKILGTSSVLAKSGIQDDDDSDNNFDPTKHMCIYCEKLFTYLGMLRKHVADICPARKELVEKDEYLDEEWELDLDIKTGHVKPNLSRQSSVSSLNGMLAEDAENSQDGSEVRARKRRRKRGHNWGYKPKGSKHKRQEEDSPYMIEDSFFAGNDSGNSLAVSVEDESSNDSSGLQAVQHIQNGEPVGQPDGVKVKIEPGTEPVQMQVNMDQTLSHIENEISKNDVKTESYMSDSVSQSVKEKLAQKIKNGTTVGQKSENAYFSDHENKDCVDATELVNELALDNAADEDESTPRKRKRRGPRLTMKRRRQSLVSPKLPPNLDEVCEKSPVVDNISSESLISQSANKRKKSKS